MPKGPEYWIHGRFMESTGKVPKIQPFTPENTVFTRIDLSFHIKYKGLEEKEANS